MGDVLSDHGLVAFSLFEILAQAEMWQISLEIHPFLDLHVWENG